MAQAWMKEEGRTHEDAADDTDKPFALPSVSETYPRPETANFTVRVDFRPNGKLARGA